MGLTEIDLSLLEAWDRIGAKCRADRMEALRRSRRRLDSYLASPPRAWCLAIRACDTRIGLHNALYEFPSWYDLFQDDETPPDAPQEEFIRDGEMYEAALKRGARHIIALDGDTIRQLNKPVMIDWPGRPLRDVARVIGRNQGTIERWLDRPNTCTYTATPVPESSLSTGRTPMRKGKPVEPPLQPPVLKLWGYDYARCHRGRGMPMAIVYSPSPIDPNHSEGRPPDPVWGTFWQSMWKEFPAEFSQPIERTALWSTWKGRTVQRGWRWTCPGRLDASGTFTGCGRPVRMLYAPIPIRTLGEAIGDMPLEMPEDSPLAGQWHPGRHETPIGQGCRAFACRHCWNVQFLSLTTESGWGQFVSYISGGLLYGKEVKRPPHEAPLKRLNRYAPRKRAIGPRREQVLDRLLIGRSVAEIACEFDLTKEAIRWHIKKAKEAHDARDVEELLVKVRSARAKAAQPQERAAG